jgi:hypothetical protein
MTSARCSRRTFIALRRHFSTNHSCQYFRPREHLDGQLTIFDRTDYLRQYGVAPSRRNLNRDFAFHIFNPDEYLICVA